MIRREMVGEGDIVDEALLYVGYLPHDLALSLRREHLRITQANNPYLPFIEDRPHVNSVKLLAQFKVAVGFQEKGHKLSVLRDVIGLIRHLPGGVKETYEDKLAKEEAKGKDEAATYGLGTVGGREFVLFANHYDFFAGTLGSVVGEKFTQAAELATKRGLPLVAVFSSGGVIQQENFAGLVQMTRVVSAIERFKAKANMPYVSVLSGQVWGGISASAVPLGDLIVAIGGTDFGFTGSRVIETYTGKKVPEGAQSAEVHTLLRNIDVLVNEQNFLPWLGKFLKATRYPGEKGIAHSAIELPPIPDIPSLGRLDIAKEGFSTPIKPYPPANGEKLISINLALGGEPPTLYELFNSLMRNPTRIDTESFILYGLTNPVPFYSRFNKDGTVVYPGIIAGAGNIGSERYLVVGNQPSYQILRDGSVIKIPSSPTPADLKYLVRIMDYGDRHGYNLVTLTDTPGAKPTLAAEFIGQSEAIAKAILRGISYKPPAIAVITGILGSGGGLALTPIADRVAMFEHAMAFVAEPSSATSILYNRAHPSQEEIETTINSMRATAQDQLELGLIDHIIPEGESNTRILVESLRSYVHHAIGELKSHPYNRRLRQRRKRIRGLKAIPLKKTKRD